MTVKKILILGPVQVQIVTQHFGIENTTTIKGLGGTPVINQIFSLAQENIKLFVLSLTDELKYDETVIFENDKVHIIIKSLSRNYGVKKLCRDEVKTIRTVIDQIKPDLIISNYSVEYGSAALNYNNRSLIIIHDHPWNILKTHKFHPYWIVRFIIAMRIIVAAKYPVSINNYIGNFINKWNKNKTRIIANPLREEVFSNYRNDRLVGLPGKNISIISVLAWGSLKNVKNALIAYKIFRTRYPNSSYSIIGSGLGVGEEGDIWALKNDCTEGVVFKGNMSNEQVMEKMKSAHILLHPSREEASSMVLAEAMAIGLPVLAGDKSGGVPEQLDFGKNGILVDIENPQLISAALIAMVENADLITSKIENARSYSYNNYYPEIFRKKVFNCFQEMN